MAASKSLFSRTLLFRFNAHSLLFPIPSFLPSKPLQFHRLCSSAALHSNTTETLNSVHQHHPWPEWVSFVDRLKSKGYFTSKLTNEDTAESFYKDMNQLKDPCLSFARDRYDLLKLLSVGDIQTVVESGCPNLFRKAVNSAKRLRAYLTLDEGEVCGACNLRGSCDRAYVILKDNEANARTVDIVRILLFYALDPVVISGEEKLPGREAVEAAVRKLLSELIELSQKTPDPPVLEPAPKAVHQKKQGKRFNDEKKPPFSDAFFDEKMSQDFEMKRGDWICAKCNFVNFSKNIRCLKCNEEGPKKDGSADVEMKQGDWICPECDFMNFYRNIRCLKCKREGPKRVGASESQMKPGDWNCPECGFMNFAKNKSCLRCREQRPKRQLLPGDWECPACDFLNYSRNVTCRKCNHERPKESMTKYEQQIWRSPY